MKNKDDLISRREALDIVAKDSGMAGTYDQIEALPGQMTAAEAWDIAKKICCDPEGGGLLYKNIMEIFDGIGSGSILNLLTPEEAKAKIEVWENRLKVGDVVEYVSGEKAVVTFVSKDNKFCSILSQNGNTAVYSEGLLRKTGKTIDIQSVLEQLKE